MVAPRKPRAKTRGKPFALGNPGKPKGTRSRATLAAEALLEGEAEKLTRKAVDLALEGDTVALRLCIERLVPPRRDRPVQFDLPPVLSSADHPAAIAAVMAAVATGELTPSEGEGFVSLLDSHRRALDVTSELSAILERLALLEGIPA